MLLQMAHGRMEQSLHIEKFKENYILRKLKIGLVNLLILLKTPKYL